MSRKALSVGIVVAVLAITAVAFAAGNGKRADSSDWDNRFNVDVSTLAGELTQDEIDGLVFMYEEEKVARDVYLTLAEHWDLRIFENIAAAEQKHMDAVLDLINRYGLDAPTDSGIGVFATAEFGDLYDDLVEQGSESVIDALSVGALIEDLDIADLRAWLTSTDEAAIERVYSNLLNGSYNHLRAFVSQLESNGVEYEPTYLDQDEVDEILVGTNDTTSNNRGIGRLGRGL